jgi:hypothetical protein
MKKTFGIISNGAAIAAALITLVPVSLFGLWIYVSNVTNGYPQNVELFVSYLPSSIGNAIRATVVSLLCCLMAALLSIPGLKSPRPSLKVLALAVLIVVSGLAFLNLFHSCSISGW